MALPGVTFRRAGTDDVGAIVGIFSRSRSAALPFLPKLHTPEEDHAFFSGVVASGRTTLAIGEGVIGFMAEADGWIEHLYLDPGMRGRGIGRVLLNQAMNRQARLQLWCFADNHAACRFYERQGFAVQRRTDGENEEGLPDILYVWQRETAPSA